MKKPIAIYLMMMCLVFASILEVIEAKTTKETKRPSRTDLDDEEDDFGEEADDGKMDNDGDVETEGDNLAISVRMIDGNGGKVDMVTTQTTIGELKDLIGDQYGMASDQIELKYHDKPCDNDDVTMEKLGITSKGEFQGVLNLRGGSDE